MTIGHLIPNYVTVMTLKMYQFVKKQSVNSHNESISLSKRNLTSLWIDDRQYYALTTMYYYYYYFYYYYYSCY